MAASNFSLVDIQDEDQEIDLHFQDFGTTETDTGMSSSSNAKPQSYFTNFHDQQDDTEKLLGDEETTDDQTTKSVHSFWTFEYYQQFFDVESKQVADRILWSMIPKPGVNYLQSYIRPNPDLYGPFWICVTLIFTTAITGNLANYFQTPDSYTWKYDFHKVTLATTSIFCYAWLVPLLLWVLLWWRGAKDILSLLDLICLYGYSLAVFVPVSLLWMIPVQWLQWCLGIVASVLSGGVLVRTILPALSQESKRTVIAIAAIIVILHASLALGFMLYFFYPATIAGAVVPDSVVTPLKDGVPILKQGDIAKNLTLPDAVKRSMNDIHVNNSESIMKTKIDSKILPPQKKSDSTVLKKILAPKKSDSEVSKKILPPPKNETDPVPVIETDPLPVIEKAKNILNSHPVEQKVQSQ